MAGKNRQRTATPHKPQRRRQFQDEPREFENIVPLNAQPFHKPQPIIAQNEAQKRYINAIRTQTITFASGPAGVGKTWLAGALAAEQLTGRKIEKIIITRPAVEAGEKLGFLPGEVEEKYAPYLAPFRDVLDERLGKSFVELALKRGKIEAAPLAYMRGRAEPLTAIIPTPEGGKKMGDVKVGDLVYGSDGRPTRVTGVFPQGVKPVVDIEFSDGSIVRCSRDHLWNTRTPSQRNRNQKFTTKTADEIQRTLKNRHGQKNHEIPLVSSPVEIASTPVPIDPYLLGCLLGDGTISGGSIHFCTADEELVGLIGDLLPAGVKIKHNASSRDGYDYYVTGDSSAANPVKDALRELGLWGCKANTKSVPLVYLHNSASTRLEVLRGLMDTDGSVFEHRSGKSRVQFYSTSPQLANDVKWIVESLGGIARLRVKSTPKNGTHKSGFGHNHDMNIVDIVLPASINPFRLTRKANKFNPCALVRLIVDVRDVGQEECQCISVAAKDSLYLTGNFIVTHNTFKNALVILDEAQNTTPTQMKMFLTRIGENCTVVVNGDLNQKDIPGMSGFEDAIKRLSFIPSISHVKFDHNDVVRSGICQEIVQAYEEGPDPVYNAR